MPGLTDNDIEALLQTLDQHHMLGELAGKTAKERIQILREKCGRQLIVAMIEATSGRPFEEKIATELDQLDGEAHKLYAFVAVASALRFSLTKDELLTAIGDVTNVVMNALQRLTARHLLSCSKTQYGLRHRVIADVVFERLSQNGQLAEVLEGLAFSAAVHITSDSRTSSQPRRLLQRILNHDFLRKNVGTEEAKNLYGELEELLSRDFNFWLHRGSLELELGNLGLAERYLITARSLNDRDLNTQSEFGYLLFRKALSNPNAVAAGEFVDEAIKMLQENIALRGAKDPHSYHILEVIFSSG